MCIADCLVKAFQGEFKPGGKYQEGQYDRFVSIEDFKDKLRRHLAPFLQKGDQSVTPPSGGFDIDGYRLRFGYEPKWDLSICFYGDRKSVV